MLKWYVLFGIWCVGCWGCIGGSWGVGDLGVVGGGGRMGFGVEIVCGIGIGERRWIL